MGDTSNNFDSPQTTPAGATYSAQSDPNSQPENAPQKPTISILVTGDGLTAKVEFSRTATNTLNPKFEDIMAALDDKGITYGIDTKYIQHLAQRPAFGTMLDVAHGKKPTVGKDGYLKYFVKMTKDMRPKERNDGTIDYCDLGYIEEVKTGQVLCEVHAPEKGEDGANVYGAIWDGIYGRAVDAPIGKNTKYVKETGDIVSEVNGNVDVTPNGIINVFDILTIPGNVDTTTGNLHFGGDIIVMKDVISGFKIESQGNIIVKGTVEGAHVIARGDITVNQSINGMNRARIIAQGNVKCKYIQNCHMEVTGSIYADSILHSTIECDGSVELTGRRGSVMGGKLTVARVLSAESIGTESHLATHIIVAGGGLSHNKRINELRKILNALDTEQIMMTQTMNWCKDLLKKGIALKPFQVNAYEHGKVRMDKIEEERKENLRLLSESQSELDKVNPADCYIKCFGNIYPGVKFMFGTQAMAIRTETMRSRVYLNEGEIRVSTI